MKQVLLISQCSDPVSTYMAYLNSVLTSDSRRVIFNFIKVSENREQFILPERVLSAFSNCRQIICQWGCFDARTSSFCCTDLNWLTKYPAQYQSSYSFCRRRQQDLRIYSELVWCQQMWSNRSRSWSVRLQSQSSLLQTTQMNSQDMSCWKYTRCQQQSLVSLGWKDSALTYNKSCLDSTWMLSRYRNRSVGSIPPSTITSTIYIKVIEGYSLQELILFLVEGYQKVVRNSQRRLVSYSLLSLNVFLRFRQSPISSPSSVSQSYANNQTILRQCWSIYFTTRRLGLLPTGFLLWIADCQKYILVNI